LTYTDVYIGRLGEGSDPLDWAGDWNGNAPARLGPFFPPSHGRAFRMLIDKIESGELPGKQVDWGAWAANLSKQQIFDFLDAVYPTDPTNSDRALLSGLEPGVAEMRDFIRALPHGRYALVASEL
jgi:hypothetical protein